MSGKSFITLSLFSVGLLLPAHVWAAEPSNPHTHAHYYTKHVETHPSQGDVREIKGAQATLVMTKAGASAIWAGVIIDSLNTNSAACIFPAKVYR